MREAPGPLNLVSVVIQGILTIRVDDIAAHSSIYRNGIERGNHPVFLYSIGHVH